MTNSGGHDPLVSILMPVYNSQDYLMDAVKSITAQNLTDFEFIIIDDGSTDKTTEMLENFRRSDNRIIIHRNPQNSGIAASLNTGLELARGKYIARMDADDISLPDRLEKQVRYMETHSEVGVCGSWAEIIGGHANEIWKYPSAHNDIYAKMLFSCTLVHPSVIMRASTLKRYDLQYDINASHFEDYDLWSRALPLIQFANIPEPLLKYRVHEANTGNLHGNEQREGRIVIYKRFFSQLKMEYSNDDLDLHESIGLNNYGVDKAFLKRARKWLEKISQANRRARLIPSDVISSELGEHWTQICKFSRAHPLVVCRQILNSPLQFRGSTGLLKFRRGIRLFIDRIFAAKEY